MANLKFSGNFYWYGIRQRIDINQFATYSGETAVLMEPIWRSIKWWNK